MAVWATLFIESWKRKESTVALRFGMSSFENEEEDRPEFQGELILSPIDGSSTVHFPSSTYHQRMALSITIILFLIFCVIGAVGGIFVLKLFLLSEPQKSTLTILGINLSSIIAAIANAVQIQIMNAVYNGIAIKLNDMENHQTDTIYEDNLIAKVFVFNCVNSYASLFYIGFIKELVGDPCIESCMAELNTTLGTIFLTKLVVGSLQSIVTAYMANQKRLKDETAGIPSDAVVTPPEYQYIQQEYHYMLGTFKDYADNMIQYGYATLFVASFPLAPIMAFFSNYIELLVDGWKLCQLHRRPIPKGAQDIGTWMGILEVMGFLSVLTNVGMICFTGEFLDGYSLVIKFAAFLILEHILLGIKSLVGFIIPDVPEDVETQLARQEFIVSKVILNMKDDELDMDELGVSEEEEEEKAGKKFKFKQAFEILHEDLDYIYPKKAEDEPIGGFLGSILTALGMNKRPVEGEQDDEEEEEMTELMD
jgi:anoctamin-10/anoctamin-7